MNLNESFDVSPAKVEKLKADIARLGIDPALIEESFVKGGGKGGQKINKTANRVMLRYPPLELTVRCQRERRRSLNRFLALRELVAQIEMRVSPGSSERLKEFEAVRRLKARRRRRSAQAGLKKVELNGMKLADWMSRLGTETSFEVLAHAKALEAQGKDIIHLEIGEPDFNTPKNIRERAKRAIDEGWTHYGPPAGLPEARAAIAEYVSKVYGVKVEPEEIIVTPGVKAAICFSIMTLVNPGDEVIHPNPGYPIYESLINFVGAKPVPVPLREENGFVFDLKELEARLTPKTRMLILNSPENPTGGTLDERAIEGMAKILTRYPNVTILSDEIYSRLIYEGRHHSIFSLPGFKERTLLLDGFSKIYAMTGWRIGYCVAPKPVVRSLAKLANNCNSCTTSFVQIAAIEALRGPQDEVNAMVQEFRRRRDVIVSELSRLPGFSCLTPKAAFYVFPNIKKTGMKSKELSDLILEEGGVACLPGTAFGGFGEGYLRFSYANSVENIKKAVSRIEGVLNQRLAAKR